ncbi:Levanase [Pontiella desulfatans]|uniref:Levanase n=1 Tax=Pontiella desulfatans TaxID=2750659 RepID=A0A6C2UAJ7_PONDE|nr:glycoside hydrolase family 32 protein [Pontiella desulfatans]VGO16883.1 Levanase [Pontiella desulfatans]
MDGKWIAAGLLVACAAHADDISIADFEGDSYGAWRVEGKAFGAAPAKANVSPPNKVTGHLGDGLVNTFLKGDTSSGSLTSPEFTIERRYINFLIGGGNHKGQTCINLLVDGKPVRTAVGSARKDAGREVMEWAFWDVEEYAGGKAVLQIVDNHTGGWGHINVDQIVQSDHPVEGAVGQNAPPPSLVALEASIAVTDSHLLVPVVNAGNDAIPLGIYDGNTLIQTFKITLPRKDDAYWEAAYPLDHFGLLGRQITVKPIEGGLVNEAYRDAFARIRCHDGLPAGKAADYAKPYRNQFHPSTRRGWNNDPNGMVYHDGKYHLYYQHNPFGIGWGNMHWGHFESTDLIHWEEKPIALFQKTVKDMMFSGGGFVDFNNSAGLGENMQFAAFTSTGRGECLAYSTDGGISFAELPENPVVVHKGRDPKIIWYEPEQKWVMAVYNTEECDETKAVPLGGKQKHVFANCAFYESRNLREWKRTGAFTDTDRASIHECPELFPLSCGNEAKWIFYGAQNRYFIGQFNGRTFVKESGPHGSRHGAFYAAQTFSDVPDGRRIQIGWVRTDAYPKQFPAQIVNQSFTLPHELTLVKAADGLRMAFNPVKEVEKLRGEMLQTLEACEGELTEVLIEFEEDGFHEIMINGIEASFEGRSARIFTDRTFNEVYADGGLYYEVRRRDPINFESTETAVKTGKIKSFKAYRLQSIWKSSKP